MTTETVAEKIARENAATAAATAPAADHTSGTNATPDTATDVGVSKGPNELGRMLEGVHEGGANLEQIEAEQKFVKPEAVGGEPRSTDDLDEHDDEDPFDSASA